MKKSFIPIVFFFALAAGFGFVAGANAVAVSKDEAFKAIVKVKSFTLNANNELVLYSTGSGIMIDSNGTVLTNWHVVTYEDDFDSTERESSYIVCLTEDISKEPDCIYAGQLISSDKDADVALLKISNISGYSNKSSFSYLDLNASDTTSISDKVIALGYPSIGGNTITTTEGIVSGKESKYGKNWIKTDAVISYGNSGGAAIDANGKVIGITTAGYSDLLGSLGYVINIASVNDWINLNKTKSAQASSLSSATESLAKKVFDYKNNNNNIFTATNPPIFSITKPDDWQFTFEDESALFIDKGGEEEGGSVLVVHEKFPYAIDTDLVEGSIKRNLDASYLNSLTAITKNEDITINGRKGKKVVISSSGTQTNYYYFSVGNYLLKFWYEYGSDDKDKTTIDAIINSISINDSGAQFGETASYTNQNPKFNISASNNWVLLARNSKSYPIFMASKDNKLAFADIQIEKTDSNTANLTNDDYLTLWEQGITALNSSLSKLDMKIELVSKNSHFKLNNNIQDVIYIDLAEKSLSSGKTLSQNTEYYIKSGDKYVVISLNYFSDNTTAYNDAVGKFNNMLASLTLDSVVVSTATGAPSATTNGATSITSSSAKLNSTINPNSSSTDVWFEYGTNSSALDKSTSSQNIGSASSYGSVSTTISSLSSNTYYFRPVAKNSSGTAYGETRSFTIEGGATSQEASSAATISTISSETGYSNGDVIKSASDFKVYVIVNGKKLHITDSKTFSDWGYNWSQVKEISQEKLGEFPEITLSSYLVRAEGDTKIYRIIGDKKVWIPSIKAFLDSGYKSNSEIDISKDAMDNFADVKYIRHKGGKKVWEIKDGQKYRIADTSKISSQDIKTITLAEFLAYPIGK